MPHLDEGALHAWLDGAAASLGEEAAGGIAAHLDACPDCRARLEEERRVRERAGGILAAARPPALAAPPFRSVLERAGAPPRRALTRRLLRDPGRLAWAASLVLALGAGWIARQIAYGPPGPIERPAPATLRAPAGAAGPESVNARDADLAGAEATEEAPAAGGGGRAADDAAGGREGVEAKIGEAVALRDEVAGAWREPDEAAAARRREDARAAPAPAEEPAAGRELAEREEAAVRNETEARERRAPAAAPPPGAADRVAAAEAPPPALLQRAAAVAERAGEEAAPGCYRLELDWSLGLDLPRLLVLGASDPDGRGEGGGEGELRDARGEGTPVRWAPAGADSIAVRGGEEPSWTLRLRIGSEGLSGTARLGTAAGAYAGGPVAGLRVVCPEEDVSGR